MQIATSHSTRSDARRAILDSYDEICGQLGQSPDLLWLYVSETYAESRNFLSGLKKVAGKVPLIGATSCRGVINSKGYHFNEGLGLGMLGIADSAGAYGVGIQDIDPDQPEKSAVQALRMALEQAHRPGEVPALIFMAARPGEEERLLTGLEHEVGSEVPVIGGSSSDNRIAGNWMQFGNKTSLRNGVAIAVLFPSTRIFTAFQCGYEPTGSAGKITRAAGRFLYEIDYKPAAEVYDQWMGGGLLSSLDDSRSIVSQSTFHPLGVQVGLVGTIPYYKLLHPIQVSDENSLELFADVNQGERIYLMHGNESSLVRRAPAVIKGIMDANGLRLNDVSGGFIIYCGGSMLAIQDKMDLVADGLGNMLNQKPFLCFFSFGEQGTFYGGENRHGNLMISTLLFSEIAG